MVRRLAVIGLGLGCMLLADDESRQNVQQTNTERFAFPPGGTLRLKNSIGELTVEGWDRPEVEITTIKSTKVAYSSRRRADAARRLDRVRIAAERQGDKIVIKTVFPRYRIFPPPLPWRGSSNFDLDYHIKVPHNTRLIVDHDAGEVHADNVTGDIRVTVLKGGITLHLPQEGKYAIDAKSDFGGVISDFPGRAWRKMWLVGHQFANESSTAAQKLYLRIGFGDITILKMQKPPTPTPLTH